jgi:chemotaxis protein CheX
MNVKFLNPFIEAAFEVLKAEAGISAERGSLGLEQSEYKTDDITVILALVGAVEGTVYYGMSNDTAMLLVSKMIGENILTFNSLAQSGIAELGNVITGRASVKLSVAGYEATISPPTLLLGKGATISTLDFARIVVPVLFNDVNLNIHLALREGKIRGQTTAQIPVPAKPEVKNK